MPAKSQAQRGYLNKKFGRLGQGPSLRHEGEAAGPRRRQEEEGQAEEALGEKGRVVDLRPVDQQDLGRVPFHRPASALN